MGNFKGINIKNRIYYFFNDMIYVKDFNSSLLKQVKNHTKKDIGIYKIGYVTMKKIYDYENISRVNPLYLIIGKVDGSIEGNTKNSYLVFDSTDDKNKEVLTKYF